MRWLLRLILFWAISAPLFYFFGLPMLIEHLNGKTRRTSYDQCIQHLRDEGMIGSGIGKITPERGEAYCHCVSDGITFTKADILDMVKQHPPTALTELSQKLSHQCNDDLSREMNTTAAAAPAEENAPASTGLTIIENTN